MHPEDQVSEDKVPDSETGEEDAREAENCENKAKVAGEAGKAEEQAEDVIDVKKLAKEPPEHEADIEVTAEETSTMEPVDSKKHSDEMAAV